jgi:hypothetical protein
MYVQYKSWRDVKDDAECAGNGKVMYYKAPLDTHPVPVVARCVFKNGKIRFEYHSGRFTVDHTHADRFYHSPTGGK